MARELLSQSSEPIAGEGANKRRAIEAFLKAASILADTHSNPEFYDLAVRAMAL
jgi:hypothetical protein